MDISTRYTSMLLILLTRLLWPRELMPLSLYISLISPYNTIWCLIRNKSFSINMSLWRQIASWNFVIIGSNFFTSNHTTNQIQPFLICWGRQKYPKFCWRHLFCYENCWFFCFEFHCILFPVVKFINHQYYSRWWIINWSNGILVYWRIYASLSFNELIRPYQYMTVTHLPASRHFYWTILLTWWRHQMETFSALLAFCAGNSPVNSPHKGQWCRALMFSFICVWINVLRVNNRGVGDLRSYRGHYDVTAMISSSGTCDSNVVSVQERMKAFD